MGNEVSVEYSYDVSATVLWKALVVNKEMKKWYFDLEEFIPEVGFEFRFWGESPNRKYLHICRITEIIRGEKICYTWRYDGIQGDTMVCFNIEKKSVENTKLILTHTGFDSFPSDNPDLLAENFKKGWTSILGTSLRNYLAK